MTKISYCRAECGARIQWGVTVTGARMPIDMSAVDEGNVVWEADGIHVHVLTKIEKETDKRPRYLSHFSTCPNRAQFKRAKK